jgi:hypothetical protein
VPELISPAFFDRLQKGRVSAVAFLPELDIEKELVRAGYEVLYEKRPREDALVVCELDFINRNTIKVLEGPA